MPGVDALLRYSNLGVTGDALAALASGLYGYLDWIARQAVPFTAVDEYLEGWAALKGILRKPAIAATGQVVFAGTSGTIPTGATMTRTDGAAFTVTAGAAIASGSATVAVVAAIPGAAGDTAIGTTLTLAQSISGITPATGDQLLVADALFVLAPVTAVVYAAAPIPNTIGLTIAGIAGASTQTKSAIASAFANALQTSAVPGGETPISAIEGAIAAVSGASGFVVTGVTSTAGSVSPGSAGNITSNTGALPVPGGIVYT